jgi:hypothetical protein
MATAHSGPLRDSEGKDSSDEANPLQGWMGRALGTNECGEWKKDDSFPEEAHHG